MEEVIPSNLDLFSLLPQQLTVSESKYEKVLSKTSLSTADIPQIEFTVNPDMVCYTDLKNSVIMLKCKYTKGDGSAIADPADIGPVQAPLTSIAKAVDMLINDSKVTPNEPNQAYISWFHQFMENDNVKGSQLTTGLYIPDDYSTLQKASQDDPQAAANNNVGLKKRANKFSDSESVELVGRIFIVPHLMNRWLLPNCKLDYIFYLNPLGFYSMSAGAVANYRFWITEAALLIRRITVSPGMAMAHSTMLQERNAVYPVKYMLSRSMNIPAQSYEFHFENAFSGNELPVSILVMFVDAAAKVGSLSENPYLFKHMDLTSLTCRLGAKYIPSAPFKMDAQHHRTQMVLWRTFMSLGIFGSNTGPTAFNRDTFDTGLAIMGLDLSRDGDPNAAYNNATFEANTLSIDGTFQIATPALTTGKRRNYIYI